MKVVINTCFGGFSLSKEAYEYLGIPWDGYGFAFNDDRTNPKLVECVKTLKEKANGRCSELKVVNIPDDVRWEIEDYDGCEWVSECHRTWEQMIRPIIYKEDLQKYLDGGFELGMLKKVKKSDAEREKIQ